MRSLFLFLFCFMEIIHTSYSQCPNGDFESGSFNGFTLWGGVHDTREFNLSRFRQTIPPSPDFQIVNLVSTDPWFPSLPTVAGGDFSARVGLQQNGGYASMLGYSFTVTEQNKFFSFRVAIVHNFSYEHPNILDQASFQYFMCRGTTPSLDPSVAITGHNAQTLNYADINQPGFYDQIVQEPGVPSSFFMYRGWRKNCINLSAYVGQQVSIFFLTAGCIATQHFGYFYIDDICGTPAPAPAFNLNPVGCYNTPVIADATNTLYEDDYLWTIEMVDAQNNVVPNTSVTNYFFNTQAGIENLTQLYSAAGKEFVAGQRYKITLGARISCVDMQGRPMSFPYQNTVQYIDIPAKPPLNAGPDHFFCCSSAPASTQIGHTGNDPSYSYNWTIKNGPFVSNLPMPTVSPLKSTTYQLTITDINGCSISDEAKIVYSSPFTASFTENCTAGPCNKALAVNLSFATSTDPNVPPCVGDNPGYETEKLQHMTYLWNTGQTTPSIITVPGTTFPMRYGFKQYSVTTSDGCQSQQFNHIIKTYSGSFPSLTVPNVFTPNGDGIHDIYYITDDETGVNSPNAYNAYKGDFEIFNRYDQSVHRQIIENCSSTGITNRSFSWDGKYNGSDLPVGEYYAILKLFNCDFPNGLTVANTSILLIR